MKQHKTLLRIKLWDKIINDIRHNVRYAIVLNLYLSQFFVK